MEFVNEKRRIDSTDSPIMTVVGEVNPMNYCVDPGAPVIEKFHHPGEFRREVLCLPKEFLEEAAIVGPPVEDGDGGQALGHDQHARIYESRTLPVFPKYPVILGNPHDEQLHRLVHTF